MYGDATFKFTEKVFEVIVAAASSGKYTTQELIELYETLLAKAVALSIELPVEKFLPTTKN